MRFDVARRPRLRSTAQEALRSCAERVDGGSDIGQYIPNEQHQPRQQALHEAGGIRPVALARTSGKVSVLTCRSAHQGRDVVGQYLGRHVDDQSLLAQARDRFEMQPMLQALERLLDAPALVVEIGEQLCGEGLGVQVRGQQTDLAIGRHLTHQAHRRGASRDSR